MKVILMGLALMISSDCSFSAALKAEASPATRPADPSIDYFRQRGQAGLDEFVAEHAKVIADHAGQLASGVRRDDSAAWAEYCTTIDRIAMQKDAAYSRLYWHTDLPEAMKAAKASGKPVLSLRLLGKLNEELSCANSRFFRAALYANASVSTYLRENYVLHWESERPAPVLTVEMGDGRVLRRTVTGNSIHYVLNADGQIISALPGMVGPGTFERLLRECASAERESRKGDLKDKLAEFWSVPVTSTPNIAPGADRATAALAAGRAVSKTLGQRTAVMGITGDRTPIPDMRDRLKLIDVADSDRLDASSDALVWAQRPNDSISEHGDVKAAFESSMSYDAAINSVIRQSIHRWLKDEPELSLGELNDRVYKQLFLTPAEDRWLGLVEKDIYSGINDDGIVSKQ